MTLILIQPEGVPDAWDDATGEPIPGRVRTPYSFAIDDTGAVQGQDFWQGVPERIVGFQNDADVQRIDVWWVDVVLNPALAVGKYPVFSERGGGLWTYTVAIESTQEV